MAVHSGPRIVVLPIEPIIFQVIDLLQTLARSRPTSSAACKIPGIAERIEQLPLRTLSGTLRTALGIAVEVDIHSIPLRTEQAYRLAIGPSHKHHRDTGDFVFNRDRATQFLQRESPRLSAH